VLVFVPSGHIARNGSGPRSGCDANVQRKRSIVASTVRLLLRLPLRGAPSEGAASLYVPLVPEKTSEIRSGAFLRLERSFVEVRKIFTFLLGDANGEAVAVFLVVEDAIHGKQELVTLRAVPAFYHDEADLHSFVIEDDVLSVSNLFVLRPINIRATYVGNVRGKNDDRLNSHSEP